MDPLQTREKRRDGPEVNTASGDPSEDPTTIFGDSQAQGVLRQVLDSERGRWLDSSKINHIIGRNVHTDSQSGATLQQVAENAFKILERFSEIRREVFVLIAGANDVLRWMRQGKTIGGWADCHRDQLVNEYVQTLARNVEKLKRFTARVVIVGVLYQKPMSHFQPEDNAFFQEDRHGLVDNLNASMKQMCKEVNKKEENRGVFKTIFYDTSRFKSFPGGSEEAADFRLDGIHLYCVEQEEDVDFVADFKSPRYRYAWHLKDHVKKLLNIKL